MGFETASCPKIMVLPRTDAVICFAGSTLRTYPLMLQLASSIASFPDSRRRILDFDDMKGHAIRVFNFMLGKVRHEVSGGRAEFEKELSSSSFLLAGFSWRKGRFRIIRVAYDSASNMYRSHSYKVRRRRTCVFIGDIDDGCDLPKSANTRLMDLLRSRGKLPSGFLDWEPFEILRDIIKEEKYRTVGGPPQVVKVYRHMNVQPFGIYWPSRKDGALTLGGRDTLDYERTDWPRLDAATLEVSTLSLDDADVVGEIKRT
jgi:hypothetical protein